MELLKDRPDIVNLVKSCAIEQGLGHYKITSVTTNAIGQGYGSNIFLVTILDSTKNKKLDLVIKTAFTEDAIRSLFPIVKCFENESHFYCTVYPAFKKFENSKRVSENIQHIPKCYRVSLKNKEEMLCLENLKSQGFELFDKKLPFDHEHVSLVFKNYGRLHAYSFALQDQQPKEYDKLTKGQNNLLMEVLEDERTGYRANMKGYLNLAKKHLVPGEDDNVMKKFEKYTSEELANIFRYVLTNPDDYSVILHGDCWSNNMMFKYEKTENGKKLVDMRLLDLQLITVCSPVNDLSYCLYSGGSKDLYDNLDTYLKIYHDSFSSFLKQLGSDPEKLFPYDALQQHWRRYSKFGMMMGMMLLKVKLSEPVEIKDGSESNGQSGQVPMNTKLDEAIFQKRVRELLHHMSDIDAL